MENRKDYEKRLGERLEAAYMQEDIGPVMSREEFHRLIQTAEKKKRRRRTMLSLAAACVALCLVCGGFLAGMTMRESASAGKGDETKTVQQGGSVVIGSGVSENDQNVGVSTKTYANIEDIPEDIRKEIHFLNSDEFELEKVKVVENIAFKNVKSYYAIDNSQRFTVEVEIIKTQDQSQSMLQNSVEIQADGDTKIYYKRRDDGDVYCIFDGVKTISVFFSKDNDVDKIKKEAILDGLADCRQRP